MSFFTNQEGHPFPKNVVRQLTSLLFRCSRTGMHFAFCPQIIECVFFHKFFLHQQSVAAPEGPRPHNGRSHLRSCVQPPCAHPLRIGQLRHRARQHQDPILDLTQILLTTIFQVLPWPPSTRGAPKFTLHIFRMPEQPKEGGIWAFITLYGQDNEPALARSHLQ